MRNKLEHLWASPVPGAMYLSSLIYIDKLMKGYHKADEHNSCNKPIIGHNNIAFITIRMAMKGKNQEICVFLLKLTLSSHIYTDFLLRYTVMSGTPEKILEHVLETIKLDTNGCDPTGLIPVCAAFLSASVVDTNKLATNCIII